MEVVETRTLGEGWLEVSRRILDGGVDATYDGQVLSVYSDGVLRNSEKYAPYVKAVNTALRSEACRSYPQG